jgi:serine/threonine protein kinase
MESHDQGAGIGGKPPFPGVPSMERPGDRIGPYKLLQQIGEGGCGVVYIAEQQEPLRRRVALKVIKLGMDTKDVIARFEAERQILALMDHPNIAKVLDAGATETGRPFFVMEFVPGERITTYCDRQNLATPERLALFVQVCHAIQHAHQKGIIHRDIKPSNILVALQDGVPVPKVIDFGIAKAIAGQRLTDKTLYTAVEQMVGTPAYMSPEQAEMAGVDVDTRTDIYSLGVLLYELLTGGTPFDSRRLVQAGLDEVRRIIREEEPPRPSTRISALEASEQTTVAKRRQAEPPKLIHQVRGDLDWIVMKCLEKDRTRRYEKASNLALDITRFLNREPIRARPPSSLYRLQKLVRRNKLAVTAAGVGALLTAVATFIVFACFRPSLSTAQAIPPPKPLPANVKTLEAVDVLNLVYSGSPPAPPANAVAPQLQFSILVRRKGQTQPNVLKDGETMVSGVDDYLTVVRAASPGYLYIFQVDAAGKTQWLFPQNNSFLLSSGSNPVQRGQVLRVPAAEQGTFYLDATTGIEHLYLVFSAMRWPELEAALAKPARVPAPSVAMAGVVQEPNNFQSRGIAGIHGGTAVMEGTEALWSEGVYSGVTNTLQVMGQALDASGRFLVLERWFRHVKSL